MIDKKYTDKDEVERLKSKAKAFIVLTSTKHHVPIDSDEVALVISGIESGDSIQVRQGMINPSFYAGIIEDTERIMKYRQNLDAILKFNTDINQYGWNDKPKEFPQFVKLPDIFDGVRLELKKEKTIGHGIGMVGNAFSELG